MKYKGTSIQAKLMRLIMLICGSVLFLACASFFLYEFITYRDLTKRELVILGQVTADNLSASLAFHNKGDAKDLLDALQAQKHIVAAVLYDNDGKLFASYPESVAPFHLPRHLKDAGYTYNENFIEGFEPVLLNQKRIGTLYIRSDMKAVYSHFLLYGIIAFVFFLLAFLLTYLLSRRMQRSISQPILHLADKAKLISQKKDYSVRAQKTSEDELGVLTDAFNQMVMQIERQNAEIRTLNANLEEKIVMRTWELQEANKALTEQNEFIQTIIDASIDLISVFDSQLNYVILNQYAASVFNKDRDEMLGKNILTVFPNLKGKPIITHLQKALNGEFIHVEAYRSQLADAYFENFFIPLKDQDGAVDRVLLIGHDITGIMKANEKLRQVNSELEKSNRDLEQFAYVASHDLQEPLRKIMTFSDLSEKNSHNPEIQKRYLQKISSSAGRMTELIKAVLNFSRLSRIENEFVDVDLNTIVEQIQTDLELLIEEKNATAVVDKLPVIKGIPLQLSQLFLNLFTNSLKFTERPPVIAIRQQAMEQKDWLRSEQLQQGEGYLKICFSDNGIGFDPQYASRVFSIFQRLHSTDKYAGTGIGLALCKRIVENHSGAIAVESEPGKGTSFFIYLPLTRNRHTTLNLQAKGADTAGEIKTP